MICPQCQCENLPASIFCEHCGVRIESVCSHCGEPSRRGAKFCRNCGQLINHTAAAAPAVVPGVPSPETYVPRHLAEKILASRQSLEGERKEVTVLFADIRGSTRLLEGLDPEEAQKLIDPVLRVMMDAVHRYEGTVNQVLGDGIMALFGAPLAHEDHALRACYAALSMQEEMRRHRERLEQPEESELQIGIGMNSGEVVVRSIDNDLNIEYSALGHTTHLAARMEELASAGAIIMTATTLRDVEGFVEVKPLGAVQAKGLTRGVEAYALTGTTAARTRVQARAARGLTPLVGRQNEVEVFNKLVEQTAAHRGQILAMVGEPGMGKSRLVHEFTRHQLSPAWLVLEAASVSYGKATPHLPLIEMLRRYFQITDRDGVENIQERVVTQVLELDNLLKDTTPPILSLLGALPDERHAPASGGQDWLSQRQDLLDMVKRFRAMDPQHRRRSTFESLKRVLIRESQRQPLLLVFEDLHWIDSETQAFLDSFVESLPMARILLLVDYRLEYSHGWGDKSYYTQLRVKPLQPTSAEELLQHLLGRNKDLAPLKQLLIQRTEGNPFFAEESVRSLLEAGVLIGEKGAYRPGLKIDEIRIPSTVQNVVADRIDRLPMEEKRVLQTAAVIGVIVPFSLLQAVAEVEDEDLRLYLTHLQTAEFLYETNLFPALEYSFKHAITSEVAYGELLRARRVALHLQILKAIEERAGDNDQDYIETLAHHAFCGESWDKAVCYSREAGAKAMSHSALREARSWYQQAFEALKHIPAGREKLEQQIDLHLDLRNALFLLGDLTGVAEHLHAAESLAETLGDRRRWVRTLNFLNSYYGLAGDPERAVQYGERALALIGADDEPSLSAVAHYYLGAAYNKMGHYSQAIDVLKRGMEMVEGPRRHERYGTTVVLSVICRSHLMQCLAAVGSFSEGVSHGEEGIRIAEELDHPVSLIYVNCSLGVLFLSQGETDKAIPLLERALRICQSASIPVYVPFVASRLGAAHLFAGRVYEALPYLEQGVENLPTVGRVGFLSLSMVWLGEGYLLSGRLADASDLAERALQLSRTHKERGHEAWSLKLLGDVALRHNPPKTQQAESYYRHASAVSLELGMRPLRAHCHLGLGELYAQIDQSDKAQKELSTAIDLYRLMEMRAGLREAEIALAKIAQTVPSTNQAVVTH
jgi:class 3 adenylate cyclase/tetratricopeptide (TPR) repeat protein